MSKVKVERDDQGIVWFEINRPSHRNAIDYDVIASLNETVLEVEKNECDKALVITGGGEKAFCSGGDLSVFHQLRSQKEAYGMLSQMGEVLYSLLTLSKPSLALLNGITVGGGSELATACDYRIAINGVKMGFVQGKLAITTGWGGATMLFEKMQYDRALYLLTTADMITAEKAYEMGFVQKIIHNNNIRKECKIFLEPIISQHVHVLQAYKQSLVRKWVTTNVKERIFAEIMQCSNLWEKEAHHQAVAAFINKKHK